MNADFEDILNTPVGRVNAPTELFDGIIAHVRANKQVPRRFLWAAAASIALLIAVNYSALRQTTAPKASITSFQNEYFPNTNLNLF